LATRAIARRPSAAAANKFERRREAVVQAAIEPLNHYGIRGMTFAHVAAKLDVVPTAVGYYFRRKEDLAAACLMAGVRKMEALIDQALEEDGARARLKALVLGFFEFRRQVAAGQEEEIGWFKDMRALQDDAVNLAYIDMFRKARQIFSTPDAGNLDRIRQNAYTHMVLAQFYWAVSWLSRYNPEDYARTGDRVFSIFERGLAAPGVTWDPKPFSPKTSWTDEGDEVGREAFLRAATKLINEEGYLGASVQKICAALGVTKGSFYHHNETKDDLVVEGFERTWKIMREIQSAADAHTSNGFDNLVATASYLIEGQISGNSILLRTTALSAVPGDMRPALLAGFDRISSRLSSVVCDGIADGSVRPVDAHAAAEVINGAINAAAELPFFTPGLTPDRVSEIYVKPLFTGMLPRV